MQRSDYTMFLYIIMVTMSDLAITVSWILGQVMGNNKNSTLADNQSRPSVSSRRGGGVMEPSIMATEGMSRDTSYEFRHAGSFVKKSSQAAHQCSFFRLCYTALTSLGSDIWYIKRRCIYSGSKVSQEIMSEILSFPFKAVVLRSSKPGQGWNM